MGKKKDTIVSTFTRVVKKNLSPCKIILFGSRAKGTARKDSDYDFLIVSSHFKRWEWEKRGEKVYHLKREIPAAMDIICLTPEEFERKKKEIGIIREIAAHGREISE